MKKPLLLLLTGILLLSSFASCSRRGQYEDILESQKEAESLDAIPETNGNITGESAPDYETPVMLKTGDAPYWEGKTMEELQAIYRSTATKRNSGQTVMPTGKLYSMNNGEMFFYNKLTGNISNWCSDPLCNPAENDQCIWWDFKEIVYISDSYIYFEAVDFYNDHRIYRCDLQRNHVEEVFDILEYIEHEGSPDGSEGTTHISVDDADVIYEKDGVLYYLQAHLIGTKSISTVYAMDLRSKEVTALSGDQDIYFIKIAADKVFYTLSSAPYTWYQTDLTFTASNKIFDNVVISHFNDQYLILGRMVEGQVSDALFSYDLKTGETYELNDRRGNTYLSGAYLYYTRNLTEEEMENDPLKDYYTYKPSGKKPSTTLEAGKIYRIYIGEHHSPEECIFQLTYKGIPVRFNDFEMDGETIYISFNHHEGFKSFYNQDFRGNEKDTRVYGIVDLQCGTVSFLELPKEE